MTKHWEPELPEGYKVIHTIDTRETKTAVILNVAAGIIMLFSMICAFLIVKPLDYAANYSFLRSILSIAVLAVYLVLHELVHGAVYKLLTKQKLAFGLSLSCAFCGVPNIYVYRSTALAALLAPFVLFSIVFIGAAALMSDPWDKLYTWFVFSCHFGGCIGDLYVAFLYLVRFREPSVLMKDIGPTLTFYRR